MKTYYIVPNSGITCVYETGPGQPFRTSGNYVTLNLESAKQAAGYGVKWEPLNTKAETPFIAYMDGEFTNRVLHQKGIPVTTRIYVLNAETTLQALDTYNEWAKTNSPWARLMRGGKLTP